jgi:iron-siderophore transport system ATP-binding protein
MTLDPHTGIEVRGLTKSYGQTVVVDDVSFWLAPGGITSIIGANGAGKSTLLSVMSRLLQADHGAVRVDGDDVATMPSEELARKLSILRQDNHLAVRLTVRDLVAFGRYPYSKGRPSAQDRAHTDRALAYLDLEPFADRFLDQLSGGQRQRAFVAMVLCQDTDYVLLDEPLNNLDMAHSVAMMQLLRRAADELGKTVVLVIHDINFASFYSDRIIALRDGCLVRQGAVEEMMRPEVMSEVFGMDFAIHRIDGKAVAVYFG